MSTDGESDGEGNSSDHKKNSKSDTWMQCNKCKYTTDYNAFLVHHVRQQHKKKDSSPAGQDESGDSEKQVMKRFKTESVNEVDVHENNGISKMGNLDPGEAETVELIAAEINNMNESSHNHIDSNNGMVLAAVSQSQNDDGTTSIVMTQGEDGQLRALTEGDNSDAVSYIFSYLQVNIF